MLAAKMFLFGCAKALFWRSNSGVRKLPNSVYFLSGTDIFHLYKNFCEYIFVTGSAKTCQIANLIITR